MGLFTFLSNYDNKRSLKKLTKIANKIDNLEDKYLAMTDDELRGQTKILKDRFNAGETLDDLLPDAFAVVREASSRVLHMRHFFVQLMGGIVLHEGRIAEMRTGEGKTLVATLPAYLNALSGKPVHVVTVNEYLAKRDAEWMGKVYSFLGMNVGFIHSAQSVKLMMQTLHMERIMSLVLTICVIIWLLKRPTKLQEEWNLQLSMR